MEVDVRRFRIDLKERSAAVAAIDRSVDDQRTLRRILAGDERAPEQRTGAVVFQPIGNNGKAAGKFEVFADGFAGSAPVKTQNEYVARPDGVAVAPDGSLYITDSEKGKVWRVFYRG